MTTTSKVVTVLGLLSGLVVASATAQAKVLEHIVFHDNTAFVSFNTLTEIDCGGGVTGFFITSVNLNGFEFTNKSTSNGDVRSNSATLSIFQQNGCTFQSVFGIGNLDGGYTQNVLKSGHFVGTVPLADFNGVPVGSATMDITVTGAGPVTQNNQHFRFTIATPTGPALETIHTAGKSVEATISSFSLSFNGAPIAAPPPEQVFAELAVTKSGTMELVKSNK
jgi:hypothetical protein